MRRAQLEREPLCRLHGELGQVVAAGVADHTKPHRGDEAIFFDANNLQSLCKPCHDAHKQAQEHQADGLMRGAGHTGIPLDRAHPWHAKPPAQGQGGGQISTTNSRTTGPYHSLATPRNGRGGL